MTASQIADILHKFIFSWTNEVELQNSIANIFEREGVQFQREVKLNSRDRIDFLVDGIGIECKVGHPTTQVIRQLHRYVESPLVKEVALVTTRQRHNEIPAVLGEKRITVIYLLETMF